MDAGELPRAGVVRRLFSHRRDVCSRCGLRGGRLLWAVVGIGLRCGHRPDGRGQARLGWTSCPTAAHPAARAAPPKFAAQTSGPCVDRASPRGFAAPPQQRGLLSRKIFRSLVPEVAVAAGMKALLFPPSQRATERRLTLKAPCAVLAGGGGQRTWMSAVGELDRMSNRAGPSPSRQVGAPTVSRQHKPHTARAPLNKPHLASRRHNYGQCQWEKSRITEV